MDTKTLISIISSFLKDVIGEKVNFDTSVLSKLEADINLLSNELAGYLLKKVKNQETKELEELTTLRIGLIEARIKLIKAELSNLNLKNTILQILNLALKLAPLLV